jgi:hypothetical protein
MPFGLVRDIAACFFILFGLYWMAAAYFDWDAFSGTTRRRSRRRAQWLEQRLGRKGVRLFYAVLAAATVTFGLSILL